MFIRVGTTLLPVERIRHIDCAKLESELSIEIHTVEDTYKVQGIEAVDIVLRLFPSFFEGRRFRATRHAWAVHNLIGHPVLQILAWARLTKLGMWVHDNTVPRPRGLHHG